MRATYSHMQILVIDEVSMVSAPTLTNLDLTLQHIFENSKPFGGISVLAVGDLFQLPPVGESPMFKGNTKGYGTLAPNVWQLFQLHELSDIVRQKEDPEFAHLLSRVRVGKHTEEDIEKLRCMQDNDSLPLDCVGVFLTNHLKDQYNTQQIGNLQSEIFTVQAKDSKKDTSTRRVPVTVTSKNAHETAGLEAEVQVAQYARYMHTKNTDVQDGLVNGAMGTIDKIEMNTHAPLKGTLYVKFDDKKVGIQTKRKSKYKHLVPIQAVTATFMYNSVQVERTQFPGTLAWGITTHKAQGSTFTYMIADMTLGEKQTTTQPGQVYTMLSRAKATKGIKIVGFEPSKIKVNSHAVEEMERLKQHKLAAYPRPLSCDTEHIIITYLNVRSLHAHYEDICADQNIKESDIVCLTETHVNNYEHYNIREMFCISAPSKHGCAIYSKAPVDAQLHSPAATFTESVAIVALNTLVVCLYIPPNTSCRRINSKPSVLFKSGLL